jgi:hypothetical protein
MHSRLTRIFVAMLVAVAVTVVGTTTVVAATVVTSGVATVQIHDDGPDGVDLYLPMPAALLDLGLAVATVAMPADELAQIRAETAEFAPTVRALADELERMPDAVLVSVVTDDESVQVEKRGHHFHVSVDGSQGERIRVSLPAKSIGKVARFLTD